MIIEPYFDAPLPKSTGRETFTLAFVETCLRDCFGTGSTITNNPLRVEDLLATLTEFTADAIAAELPPVRAVIASGGGVHNEFLIERLQHHLPRATRVVSSANFSIDPLFKESYLFCLLGYLSWHQTPIRIGQGPARIAGQFSFAAPIGQLPAAQNTITSLDFFPAHPIPTVFEVP